jgi:hypothetical protein
MTQPLFRLLNKKDMFPAGSSCRSVLRANYGDGYKALKQILFPCHPVYHEQPATMITQYPRQKEKSLVEYHALFNDYLQMRAFIQDYDASLDSPGEMDIFIRNTKHYMFLNRVTRDERTSPAKAYKYTGAQIVETLESFLSAADSPALAPPAPSGPVRASTPSGPVRASTRNSPRRVNQLAVSSADDDSAPALAESASADSDDSLSDLLAELHTMDIPDDLESFRVHALYARSIYALQASSNQAPTTCIVCGGTHRFDGCPVLQNTEFLRGHYIRYCQQARRDASSRAAAFPGTSGEVPPPVPRARVNALAMTDVTASLPSSEGSDSDDDTRDFQTGRR